MKVYILTHGAHKKGGNNAATYDGPLTQEAKDKITAIQLPQVDTIYRGIMQRHLETAEAMGLTDVAIPDGSCGQDKLLFDLLDNNNTEIVTAFQRFLDQRKAEGRQSILIISSRMMPVIFKYLAAGGETKMGPFNTFCKVVEAVSTWDGTKLPVMESGLLHEFEV